MILPEKDRLRYIELCTKQGMLQARATMRANWRMNHARWYDQHKAEIAKELDRIDGEEEK